MNEDEIRQRLQDLDTRIHTAETAVFDAVLRAIRTFLQAARTALLAQPGRPSLAAFPHPEAWVSALDEHMVEHLQAVYRRAWRKALAAVPEGRGLIDPYIERHLVTVADRLRKWPDGVFHDIRAELQAGISAGESVDQLRDRIGAALDIDAPSREIRDKLASLGRELVAADAEQARQVRAKVRALRADLTESEQVWHWQARRIARTEATAAMNAATYDAADAMNRANPEPGVRKQWIATGDDRVRDAHARANGQVVPLNAMFTVGGHFMRYPGDPAAPASLCVNCRCSMAIIPAGEPAMPLLPIGTDEDDVTAAGGPVTAPTATEPALSVPLPDGWRGLLAPLGSPSGDGRIIMAPGSGGLDVRPLPLPLLAQAELAPGHDGAIVVGLHDRVWMENAEGGPALWGEGPLDLADADATQWARRLGDGYAGWISVDLDAVTAAPMMYNATTGHLADLPEPEQQDSPDGDLLVLLLGEEPELPDGYALVFAATQWRFMSATLVSQPAFPTAKIQPLWGYTGPGTGSATPPQTGEPMSTQAAAPPPGAEPEGKPDEPEQTFSPGDEVVVDSPDAGGPGTVTAVNYQDIPAQVTVDLEAGGEVVVPLDQVRPQPESHKKAKTAAAMLAAGAPLKPPHAWFTPPRLDGPTPLTITEEGRVYGHLAVFGTCHIGFDGVCITPPSSATDYALFHVGEVETAEGAMLPVGKVTLGGGHADAQAGFRAATEHYDVSCTTVAVVRASEDAHGIVVAGALCAGLSDERLAELRRSPLSGDWRRVGGNLELVAALAVNTPGFPVKRPPLQTGLAAGGVQVSLVAAGAVMPAGSARERLAGVVARAVRETLDERARNATRAANVADRMAAALPRSRAWARTRAAVAAARMAGAGAVAKAVAARHGYHEER